MRHLPLKEMFGIAVVFLLLCIPTYKLTTRSDFSPQLESEEESSREETIATWVSFKFAHSPKQIEFIQNDQRLLLHKLEGEHSYEEEFELSIQDGHVDLVLQIEWPAETPETIAELSLEPDGLNTQTLGVWGQGDDCLHFHFKWSTE